MLFRSPLVKAAKVFVEPEPVVKAKPGKKVAAKTSGGKNLTGKKPTVKAPPRMPTTTVDSSYAGRIGKTNDWTAKRNATQLAEEPVAVKARKPAVKTPMVKIPVAKTVAAKKIVAKKAAVKTAAKKPAPKKTVPLSK